PWTLTWVYQSSPARTVSETRGSRRRWASRVRDSSRLTRIWSPSRTYQVATVTGWPSERSVAITHGLGRSSSARRSSGRGDVGTGGPPRGGAGSGPLCHRRPDGPTARRPGGPAGDVGLSVP